MVALISKPRNKIILFMTAIKVEDKTVSQSIIVFLVTNFIPKNAAFKSTPLTRQNIFSYRQGLPLRRTDRLSVCGTSEEAGGRPVPWMSIVTLLRPAHHGTHQCLPWCSTQTARPVPRHSRICWHRNILYFLCKIPDTRKLVHACNRGPHLCPSFVCTLIGFVYVFQLWTFFEPSSFCYRSPGWMCIPTHKAWMPLQGVDYSQLFFSRGRCHLLLELKHG